jgi:hypothetical protein
MGDLRPGRHSIEHRSSARLVDKGRRKPSGDAVEVVRRHRHGDSVDMRGRQRRHSPFTSMGPASRTSTTQFIESRSRWLPRDTHLQPLLGSANGAPRRRRGIGARPARIRQDRPGAVWSPWYSCALRGPPPQFVPRRPESTNETGVLSRSFCGRRPQLCLQNPDAACIVPPRHQADAAELQARQPSAHSCHAAYMCIAIFNWASSCDRFFRSTFREICA